MLPILLIICVFLVGNDSICVATNIPTYYIDPKVLQILSNGRESCLRANNSGEKNARTELNILKDESASEFFRSHELFAHEFFVESGSLNPHRRYSYDEAELEYVPLLPLFWRVGSGEKCGYKIMIENILQAQVYMVDRDQKHIAISNTQQIKPKFSVASTFNLRTALGTGMPTQVRRGAAWESVSAFIMSLSIGHYERWPQCPDLLRKSFKYIVELPYVTLTASPAYLSPASGSDIDKIRKHLFYFSGNFALFGPEMICSLRNEVINISPRSDVIIVNTTLQDANSALDMDHINRLARNSVFCLIAKSDSYSTAFFYAAITNGCIPIVISDWFTFSFPWLIPYDKFVIRVTEVDFLANPHFVLDFIRDNIYSKVGLIADMRAQLHKYRDLLSFDRVHYGSKKYRALLDLDSYHSSNGSDGDNSREKPGVGSKMEASPIVSKTATFSTYLPLELMLLELRYNQKPHQYYNNVPCTRPNMCARDHLNSSYAATRTEYVFPAKITRNTRTSTRKYTEITTSNTKQIVEKAGYEVVNDGYQVKALNFPAFEDLRNHLCRHNNRLIGSYKIVFYMQCVRILWPLHPGMFKPVDNIIRYDISGGDARYDASKAVFMKKGGKLFKNEPEGISKEDMVFVSTFHNLTKPADWVLTNRPVITDKSHIYNLKSEIK